MSELHARILSRRYCRAEIGAATSQERRIASTAKVEVLIELRERLEAEALHAFRYGGQDPDASGCVVRSAGCSIGSTAGWRS